MKNRIIIRLLALIFVTTSLFSFAESNTDSVMAVKGFTGQNFGQEGQTTGQANDQMSKKTLSQMEQDMVFELVLSAADDLEDKARKLLRNYDLQEQDGDFKFVLNDFNWENIVSINIKNYKTSITLSEGSNSRDVTMIGRLMSQKTACKLKQNVLSEKGVQNLIAKKPVARDHFYDALNCTDLNTGRLIKPIE